jgi:Xaa-Pro aminopeptidase
VPGFESIDAGSLRQLLTDGDIERYRTLDTDAAAAVERVCRDCFSTDTERAVVASLRGELARDGIETLVTLVGSEESAPEYRHFTPTETELGGYALVSVTAQCRRLHASLTHTVAFDPPDWLADRHAAATTVDVAALRATRAVARQEGTVGEVFAAIRDAYDAVGYPGEWEAHHQGSAAGYAGREWITTPGSDAPVTAPMAYAWNPTVQGAKSEDTALVGENGIEVLTETGDWPMREAATPDGEFALARHDVLYR